MRLPPCLSLLEMLHACVGDLFLARFLRCQSVLCVSDYLSLHAPSSFYFLVMPPLLPFHPHSHSPSLSNPCHLFVLFLSLCYVLRLCSLPVKNDTRVLRLVVSLICLIYLCGVFFVLFFRILKAVFDLKPVDLHEIPARPGCCFNSWDRQPKGPEVGLMTPLQSASTGLLPAWEDDIFHQFFIFVPFFGIYSDMSEMDCQIL